MLSSQKIATRRIAITNSNSWMVIFYPSSKQEIVNSNAEPRNGPGASGPRGEGLLALYDCHAVLAQNRTFQPEYSF